VIWRDGNFLWGTEITLFLLLAVTVRLWSRQVLAARLSWKSALPALILALHLASGVVYYLAHLTPEWRSWL